MNDSTHNQLAKFSSIYKLNDNLNKRIIALDLGTERTGVAVCDELHLTIRPLEVLRETNWKRLLQAVRELCLRYDACAVVVGLPLNLNDAHSTAANNARRKARNLALSLQLPIFLQDEKLTSRAAEDDLRAQGYNRQQITRMIDSHAAAIILGDFLKAIESGAPLEAFDFSTNDYVPDCAPENLPPTS